MNSLAWTPVFAFVCGVLVYVAVTTWFPEIDVVLFTGIVGLAALAGGALGTLIAGSARRRSRGRR